MRRLVRRARRWTTSLIAYVEARGAFARKLRLREIDPSVLKPALAAFEREWEALDCIRVDDAMARQAADFAELYALRAYDAIHLASADLLRGSIRSGVEFACFDEALNRAAARIGLQTLSIKP